MRLRPSDARCARLDSAPSLLAPSTPSLAEPVATSVAGIDPRDFRASVVVTRLAVVAFAVSCASGLPSASPPATSPPAGAAPSGRLVFVGAYTAPGTAPGGHEPSQAVGISVFRMDPGSGALTLLQVLPSANPSYLALDPSGKHLYCTNEEGVDGGQAKGRVSAFSIDPRTGTLSFLNTQPTGGAYPAHLSVHPSGRYLLASNYGTGDYPVFRLLEHGEIGPKTSDFQGPAHGVGPHPDRQEGPHAHQILTDPDGRHVFGVDLGADQIHVLTLDGASGTLTPGPAPPVAVTPGSGPRHMVFPSGGRVAYILDELDSTIATFRVDPASGALGSVQTVSTLPEAFRGKNQTAEIRIHPNGKFVYATNRGDNSIAIFTIDHDTGQLHSVGWEPTRGDWPRGMNLDPTGTFLYVANQNSGTIVVFRIDGSTGRLQATGTAVRTPDPADIEFGL